MYDVCTYIYMYRQVSFYARDKFLKNIAQTEHTIPIQNM